MTSISMNIYLKELDNFISMGMSDTHMIICIKFYGHFGSTTVGSYTCLGIAICRVFDKTSWYNVMMLLCYLQPSVNMGRVVVILLVMCLITSSLHKRYAGLHCILGKKSTPYMLYM